ncbi:hypothetical protein ADIAG_03401 [Paeniglutamicibacter gangotriensis Lz1y]|uniref:Uncharacterized protein n=2 Tax=Paeniglutamicibacter gangotriensis TaxID=254787 RepID=M7N650_9MICC|nr:hypothetical protein ADIAG_03401 [Paeniglutamicibacter gangotriensis Lz1y]
MRRRTKVSVAMKGLKMSNSDTRTSAASKAAPQPDGEPGSEKKDSAPTPSASEATTATDSGPTDFIGPAEKPAPTVNSPVAKDSPPSLAGNPQALDTKSVSGGFSGINNWLDSMPDPDLERLGDKIFAAPATIKAKWHQRRIERAKAAELKEQERLVEVARAEAQAEAEKRAATRLAHQAALDAAARDAAEAQRAAQARAEAEARDAAETQREAQAQAQAQTEARELAEAQRAAQSRAETEARFVAAETARLKAPAQQTKANTRPNADPATAAQAANTTPSRTAPAPRKTTGPEDLARLVASAKAAIDHQQSAVEPVYVAPYELPDFSPNPVEQPSDLRRRILGSLAAVAGAAVSLAILDTLVSGSVESLGSNYSMMSLTPTAHLIWPVIFIWALLGAAFSWVPGQRSAVRQRAVGIPFALSCAAAILWMVAALNSWLLLALFASAASCWFLYTAMRTLNRHTARTTLERMLTDAPISLMTGFSLVVLASTFTNLLTSWGAGGAGIWVATVLVPVVAYASTALAMTERGRIILAIGVGWGMFWLLIPRVLGTNNSIWIAILAGMAGFVVLLATENRRYQIHHAEHRAARGKSTDFA